MTTIHGDNSGVVSQGGGLQTNPAPAFPEMHLARSLTFSASEARRQLSMRGRARPHVTLRDLSFVPALPLQGLEWEEGAALMTFYVEPVLLGDTARYMIPEARGELVWVRWGEKAESLTPAVHPALIVHTADIAISLDRVELVPHLPARDPLLQHVVLVLKGEIGAEGMAGRVYAEVLANALAVHVLRRYAACRPMGWEVTGGLPPAKLQRAIAYIQAHLTAELSLAALAAVVQLSPDHFGRLFKQATGQTPHQ